MILLSLVLAASPPSAWTAFDRAFRSFIAADSVVGGSALLVRDGRIIARTDIGLADRGRNQPIDSATIFHWGSITKTLTAAAIMQLRDRGLLSLDDPVVKWVPELRAMHDPYGPIDKVTVRMLLSHTGGFQSPTWPYGNGNSWEPFEPTTWEQLVGMMPYQEVGFEPGSRYRYSNPGFIYLARIIEAVTGDPWISYIQKNLWSPLGMSQSYANTTPWHLAPHRSNNYTLWQDSAGTIGMRENGREFNPGITIPNGGWNAPMADVVTWATFLMQGAGPADQVLRRGSLREMWQPVVQVGGPTSMGLSFFLRPDGLVFHTGEQAGFRSIMMLDPARRAAVILNVNTVNDADEGASAARWAALLEAAAEVLRNAR